MPVEAPEKLGSRKAQSILKPLGYQKRFVLDRSRFSALLWSRQIGKSWAIALRNVDRAFEQPGRLKVLLSAGERQSRELMRKAQDFARIYDTASRAYEGEFMTEDDVEYKQLEIRLPNDARLIGLPANPDTARGWSGDVTLDEYAVHRDDEEIWRALYPTITRGYELCVSSTPKGKRGRFYRICTEKGPWRVDKMTIHDAVADGLNIDPEELRIGLGDEEAWRQEYLCEFLDEATAFIPWELILGCEHDDASLDLPPDFVPVGDIYIGWDVARWHDLSVMWVCEKLGDVLWTRAVIAMKRVEFSTQMAELANLMDRLKPKRAAIDATGMGEMVAEYAERTWGKHRIDRQKFTVAAKDALAGGLRSAMEDRRIRLPGDEGIRQDFHCIKKTVTAAGNVRFEGEAKGSHADRFWGCALCVEAANAPAMTPGAYVRESA